jgi:uncharacterized protein YegL
MSKEQQIKQAIVNSAVASALFEKLGFETATKSTLPAKLRNVRIDPNGSTAMRDAIMLASMAMLELEVIISQLGGAQVWNFVHIVLTDGDDNSSKTTHNATCEMMSTINTKLQFLSLKTFFIGVGLGSRAKKELGDLALSGGKNSEFIPIDEVDIESIFERIKVSLGIIERTGVYGMSDGKNAALAYQNQKDVYLMMKKQRYVVLFTLDMSGSMEGSKWGRVCQSVNKFVNYLGGEDLVGAIIFNDKCSLVINKSLPLKDETSSNQMIFQNQNQNTGAKKIEFTCFKILLLAALITIVLFVIIFLAVYFSTH